MRYYIVTTTKFADQCIEHLTYGATQSNWLANINHGDSIFISQFNYNSQKLFGPFQARKTMFYNKTAIYPLQKYFYRIKLESVMKNVKCIDETDLYLSGIQTKNVPDYTRIINLIQQNKHLHCISLTDQEGVLITNTFLKFGINYGDGRKSELVGDVVNIDREYIWQKNKLDKTNNFSSESDLESYLIFTLKQSKTIEYRNINGLLKKFDNNELHYSSIYNQFIFGNAYPSDLTILNENNINVFELKKDSLSSGSIAQIEKEIKKHLYYSLFSNRLQIKSAGRFNFYLICLKDDNNKKFGQIILGKYNEAHKKIGTLRENNIVFVDYSIKNNALLLEEIKFS